MMAEQEQVHQFGLTQTGIGLLYLLVDLSWAGTVVSAGNEPGPPTLPTSILPLNHALLPLFKRVQFIS